MKSDYLLRNFLARNGSQWLPRIIRPLRMKKFLAFALPLFCTASVFAADVAYTKPVGGITVTLSAAVNGVPKISTFTPSMRLPVGESFTGSARGVLTGVTSTSFSDSNGAWTASSLATAGAPYFVRIRSGAANGSWWQISANDSTNITVTSNRGFSPVAAGVVVGDSYEIVPADTLQTLFSGVASQVGGTSASAADAVRIHDGVAWREYYFNTTSNVWREGNIPGSRNGVIIRPDTGVVFIRKGATPVSFVMMGNVSTGPERVAVGASGVTVIGNVFPVARTLGSFSLQTASGFIRNTGTLAAADKVNVFDGVAWKSFNYSQANSRWQEAVFDRTNYAVPFGATLVLERGAGSSTGYWVTLNPPYSL